MPDPAIGPASPEPAPTGSRAGLILGGGRSRRLGQDKLTLKIDGLALLERVARRLASVVDEVMLVLAQGQETPALAETLPVRVVRDLERGKGVLGGLYSGLAQAGAQVVVAVACDMPFLDPALIRHLLDLSHGYDVVMPVLAGRPEPLHAVYTRSCLEPMAATLGKGGLKIVDFFPRVRVKYVDENESPSLDPRHLSFFNINTAQDLARARELLALEKDAPDD